MKKAKVSSVYEGKGRKRNKEHEENARRARMNARARRQEKNVRDQCFVNRENMVRTRSMSRNSGSKRNEIGFPVEEEVVNELPKIVNGTTNYEVDNSNGNTNNVNRDGIYGGLGETSNYNMVMEKTGDGNVWWEEWPLTWSYEEEWMWSGAGAGAGAGCMGGEFQADDQEEPWEDDIWK